MIHLYISALAAQDFCERQAWAFCIIGGVAVQRWGEVRLTNDVDLTLLAGFGQEENFVRPWLENYRLRPPCDNVAFAVTNRVLLLTDAQGTPFDIALGALDFERRAIERSTRWMLPDGRGLRTCSAEDLLVHKCFADREQDWVDVNGILARQHGKLDLNLVRTELRPLAALKEESEILHRLERKIAHQNRPFIKIKPRRPRP